LAVASKIEMYSVWQRSTTGVVHRVAGLVSALKYPEFAAAIVKHLRHEWKIVKAAGFVQRAKDLFLASNLNPIARA
jgi:hypothetical protein